MKKFTVTLDTNVIVSGIILARGNPALILSLWKKHSFTLILSSDILEELKETLRRLKIAKHYDISPDRIKNSTKLLRKKSRIVLPVPISSSIPLRDQKDAEILGTALSGKADYLVTGDKDLLVLEGDSHIGSLHIVTPKQFFESMEKQ